MQSKEIRAQHVAIMERARAADAERIASAKRLLDDEDYCRAAEKVRRTLALTPVNQARLRRRARRRASDARLKQWHERQNEYWRLCADVQAGHVPPPADTAAVEAAVTDRLNFKRRMASGEIPMPSNVIPLIMPAAPAVPDRLRASRIDAASLDGKPVPVRQWHVPGLIPTGTVTALYGDGGAGKSTLAEQLAVATVTGGMFFARQVSRGAVEFVTAEDSLDELHRRLVDIARVAGVELRDLAGLRLTSLADADALLAVTEDGRGGALVATALYAELDALLSESRPALLVLDTAADVFGGNEIVRSQVRQFIGMLRRLCLKHETTILLLAHPSVAGMEKGTSGSTAWSNSVRSRLFLSRVYDADGSEPDTAARVLRVGKANYAETGQEIPMRWQNGVFIPAGGTGGDPLIAATKADRVFLALLAKSIQRDQPVSMATGRNYAPTIFEPEARAEGIGKRALTHAMMRLLDAGRIESVPYGPPSRGTKRLQPKE